MHIAAKLTLGVGVGMLLIGILLGGLGARAAGSVEDFSVEEDEVWNGSSGQYIHKLSLIHISEPTRPERSRMPSSA